MYVCKFFFHTAWAPRKKEGCKKTKKRKEESPKKSAWNQEREGVSWKEEIDCHHVFMYRKHIDHYLGVRSFAHRKCTCL